MLSMWAKLAMATHKSDRLLDLKSICSNGDTENRETAGPEVSLQHPVTAVDEEARALSD